MPTYLVPAALFAWLFTRAKPAKASSQVVTTPIKAVGTHSWSYRHSPVNPAANVFEIFDHGQYVLTYSDPSKRVIEVNASASDDQFNAAKHDLGVQFGEQE